MKKLMLVDDEPDILEVFSRRFSSFFDIDTFTSAGAALQALEKHHMDYGAVISDMRMPVMDGLTFLTIVKRNHPHLSTFVLTGNANFQNLVDSVNSSRLNGYFDKPWKNHEEMTAVIHQALTTSCIL